MNTNYMLLTNKQDYGKVIKRIGGKSYIYINGEWKRTGCMVAYLWPESPLHEMYKEITAEEAMKRIAEMK